MKPLALVPWLAAALLFLIPLAAAQADGAGANESVLDLQLSPFVRTADWAKHGSWLALGGALGGLVALMPFVGTALPGTVSGPELDRRVQELEKLKKERDRRLADQLDHAETASLMEHIATQESRLSMLRFLHFGVGALVFLAAGVLTAIIFAQDVGQAVLFGFAGPAVVGAVLKRRETHERVEFKNEVLAEAAAREQVWKAELEKAKEDLAKVKADLERQGRDVADMPRFAFAAPERREEFLDRVQQARKM